jgi:hypothetical protein
MILEIEIELNQKQKVYGQSGVSWKNKRAE